MLAIVPPEALSTWMGWSIVDPQYVATLVLWWAVDAWVSLILLSRLIRTLSPSQNLASPASVLLAALNAEALLDARCGIWALFGLVPALALLAADGAASAWARIAALALAGLGLLPATYYFLRRCLATASLLQRRCRRGAEALDWSAQRLAQDWKAFFRLALPWWALGWALDGSTLLLGNADSWGAAALGWALAVPSLIASLLPIALFCAHEPEAR